MVTSRVWFRAGVRQVRPVGGKAGERALGSPSQHCARLAVSGPHAGPPVFTAVFFVLLFTVRALG